MRELWATLRVGDSAMDRVNLPFFYRLGATLRPLCEMNAESSNRFDVLIACFAALEQIRTLFSTYPALTVCRSSGQSFIASMDKAIEEWHQYRDLSEEERIQAKPVSDQEAKAIITHIIEFQTVLTNELQTFAAYQIGRKGIYSTSDLIEQADNIFGEKIHKKLAPETWKDISESGRCLAFDLATATAFHIWRAVERELRTYYEIWTGHPALKKAWATLLIGLKTTKADGKVIAVLDQLRDLHRNPTIHPASEIDIDDALALFGIASSAITSMVNDVPAVRLGLGSSVR